MRWGPRGVFVARFLPGLRFLAGPLAGAVGLHFTAFITANVLGALVYVPAVVAAGYVVGYGAGAYLERVLQALGPVEYIVLAVPVILVASVFVWRAVRAFNDRARPIAVATCCGRIRSLNDRKLLLRYFHRTRDATSAASKSRLSRLWGLGSRPR